MKYRLLAALFVVATARIASAQIAPRYEFGMDAGISRQTGSPAVTTVSLPVSRIRLGVFLAPILSVEASGGLTYLRFNGSNLTNVIGSVSAPLNFNPPGDWGPYLRPLMEWSRQQTQGGGVSNTYGGGVGFGGRLKLGDNASARVEAALIHRTDTRVDGLIGLSWFMR